MKYSKKLEYIPVINELGSCGLAYTIIKLHTVLHELKENWFHMIQIETITISFIFKSPE